MSGSLYRPRLPTRALLATSFLVSSLLLGGCRGGDSDGRSAAHTSTDSGASPSRDRSCTELAKSDPRRLAGRAFEAPAAVDVEATRPGADPPAPMALPGAVPLGGATIEIYSLGGGASEGEALAQGRTEDDGSWCVRSAEALEARSGLLVEVSYESGDGMTRRLRRITFDPRAATVGPLSEAQVRVVEDCGVGLSSVTRARWTNLETMVATTVAVFDPMVIRSDESSDSVIERAVRALRADPRIGAAMSEMEGCTLEE